VNAVFADTLYWIASILPDDSWHEPALRAGTALASGSQIVTTHEVLSEVLSAFAGRARFYRSEAVAAVRAILNNSNVTVLQQSAESFTCGFELYERRPDKGYSLVDCVSMSAMREHGISSILTNDHHFAQEGFTILISK
jgi:predicted nucleic acid-binding protein